MRSGIDGHVRRRRSEDRCHALQQSCLLCCQLINSTRPRPSSASLRDCDGRGSQTDPFARRVKIQLTSGASRERERESGEVQSGNTWLVVVAHYTCARSRPPRSFASFASFLHRRIITGSIAPAAAAATSRSGKMSTRLGTEVERWSAAATQKLTANSSIHPFFDKTTAVSIR